VEKSGARGAGIVDSKLSGCVEEERLDVFTPVVVAVLKSSKMYPQYLQDWALWSF
jgi:hypothetical protein